MTSRSVLACGFVLFATAACSSGNGGAAQSIPIAAADPAASSVPISTIGESTTATTSPDSTIPATIPDTTVLVASPSTTSVVASTTLDVGVRAHELVVIWASGAIAIHDPDTGRLIRVVTTVDTEGRGFYDLVRSPDGAAYMGMGVEDSWYSCETVEGSVIALTPEGELATIGSGGGPHASANGSHLAYVRSSECRPDPSEPDYSFAAVADTVVVRDLATGDERSWTFPGAFDDPMMRQVVDSAVWYGDSLLVLVQGRLIELDLSDPDVPRRSDGPAVQLAHGDPGELVLLGARADGTVLAQVFQAEGEDSAVRIVALDPTTGREVAEIATIDRSTFVKLDGSGTRWAAVVDGAVIVDGHETTLEVPPWTAGFDTFADRPDSVGW